MWPPQAVFSTAMPNPKIFVIAGPNGAGKSTAAATIPPTRFPTDRFLNADQIARALAFRFWILDCGFRIRGRGGPAVVSGRRRA